MKVLNQAVLLSACVLALASCSDDNPWQGVDGEGGISLKLTTDGKVENSVPLLRSEGEAPDVPEVSEFGITLTKKSTLEVLSFASLEEFNARESFATGGYTIAASYGSADNEGFESPRYYGEADVTVLDGRQSEVEVTVRMASSMVTIDYSDAFKTYFKAYSATVHSEGHSYVDFAADETRPAYINPGEVSLTVHVTNQSNKSVDLQPASFPAEAAHHYRITFDVNNGNVGQAQLVITFDDTLERENVEIDLTDELFTSAAPKVTPIGFTDGQLFETVENSTMPEEIKYNLSAAAGFKSAILTIAGEGFTPDFGNEIDLCAATPAQQAQLAAAGIKVRGLFDKTEKYASVDLSGLPMHLPTGTFTVTLVAHDKFTRVSEPVSVKFSSYPVVFDVENASAVINSNRATVTLDYNGADPSDITFTAMDRHGVYKECEVLNVQRARQSRSIEAQTYTFEIVLPDTDRANVPVRAYVSGNLKKEFDVEVVTPQYSVQVDGFSKFAAIKINPVEADQKALITNTTNVYVNNTLVGEDRLNRNAETGIITVTGLNPSTEYRLHTSLYADGSPAGEPVSFTSEAGMGLTNGDFSQTSVTINRENVMIGGKYSYTVAYEARVNMLRSEADGWASINGKTCWWDAPGAENTWFQVPSTYAENGQVIVRNVAYDHNGTTPAGMPTGLGKTSWYNTNVPTFTTAAAGELFLGSYSFDGSEHRVNGIEFACRPNSVTFDYSYAPTGNDHGKVEIAVLDAAGNTVASGTANLESASSMTSKTVNFTGYTFGAKAAKLVVRFLSSATSNPLDYIHIPQGSELAEGHGAFNFGNGANSGRATNDYHALATGSVLTLDNVKLNY